MRISILNNCYFSEEHLNRLKALGEVSQFDGTNSSELTISRAKGSDIIICDGFLTNYDEALLSQLQGTKLLALNTTAFGMVDVASARKYGIEVRNNPGFSMQSTAELTIGLIFAALRQIVRGDKKFRNHPVDDMDPASPEGESFMGFELQGRVLGVVGLGRIGKRVADLGAALGMKVQGYNRTPIESVSIPQVDLKTLLETSDVVTLNLAYAPETNKILNKETLAYLKSGSVLVNTGSAKLVDTDALYEVLKSGKIRSAALDVVDIAQSHPITELDNVVFTPHIGSYTEEAYKNNLPEMIVSNIENFVAGKQQNVVN